MSSRLIFHPIFENKRSRYIFMIFIAVALSVGMICWIKISHTLEQAGLARNTSAVLLHPILKVLLSNYFQAGLIMAVAVIGTGLTARHVVGPIRRIEQWLGDWNDDLNPFPLLVRKNDKFSHLVEILNKLYQKASRPPDERPSS